MIFALVILMLLGVIWVYNTKKSFYWINTKNFYIRIISSIICTFSCLLFLYLYDNYKSNDVIFVVDSSTSMYCNDVGSTRIDFAEDIILNSNFKKSTVLMAGSGYFPLVINGTKRDIKKAFKYNRKSFHIAGAGNMIKDLNDIKKNYGKKIVLFSDGGFKGDLDKDILLLLIGSKEGDKVPFIKGDIISKVISNKQGIYIQQVKDGVEKVNEYFNFFDLSIFLFIAIACLSFEVICFRGYDV